MRKVRVAVSVALGCGVLIGCSTFRDQSKAMVGGGAVAGQDYINGLTPSEKARTYFAQNASDESSAVTISRTGDGENNTGVRFVANGGVVIPPGSSITFENQGYCCDPHLPAPKAGDEFQFVKTTQLIPEELQSIYRKLLTKASNGDEATLKNMQKLVWALRTAGTEAGYANNLTDQQKKILNSCSEYEGEFELYCSEKLALSRFWKKFLAQADSYTTINIGGVTYQASDLLDDNVGEKKIKEHLGQLITLGESMPVEHNGFNYGELASGIYTDIKGTGPLKFKATVANSTTQNFTFYPMDYIAQVGSGVSDESASVVYFATASSTQKQRVTTIISGDIAVIGGLPTNQGGRDNCSISLRPENARIDISEEHQVRNLQDAVNKFETELRTIPNHKNSDLEYYAYCIQYNGETYLSDLAGHFLTENTSLNSATTSVSMSNIPSDFGKHTGDNIIAVIHSHPPSSQSEKFSQADRNFVNTPYTLTYRDGNGVETHRSFDSNLVLVDTGHEHRSWIVFKEYDRYIMEKNHTYSGNSQDGYEGDRL